MVMTLFNEQKQIGKSKVSKQQADKKSYCSNVKNFCSHCNIAFETMGCFYQYCFCQEAQPSPTEENIERGCEKRELDEIRCSYVQEKDFTVIERWECE